jgi:hypothetical protein
MNGLYWIGCGLVHRVDLLGRYRFYIDYGKPLRTDRITTTGVLFHQSLPKPGDRIYQHRA